MIDDDQRRVRRLAQFDRRHKVIQLLLDAQMVALQGDAQDIEIHLVLANGTSRYLTTMPAGKEIHDA